LNRSPDAGGLQGFTNVVEHAGGSLTQVAQAIITSPEFTASHADVAEAAFVDLLYEGALGRHAEAGGLQFWTDALAHGASHAQVALGIAESAGAQQHLLASVETGWVLQT
ncbi:MAG TPA: DUF4214 domain-containing protein, partial [Steroidobacteraceae bacterium]|nr:DUF4214 domain-containing protein [Steroidobacteraceae bacterium]